MILAHLPPWLLVRLHRLLGLLVVGIYHLAIWSSIRLPVLYIVNIDTTWSLGHQYGFPGLYVVYIDLLAFMSSI